MGGPVERATADSATFPLFEESPARSAQWVQLGVLALLTGMLYYSVWLNLAHQWWSDPDFSHGFFVPLFSVFVLWRMRRHLGHLEPRPTSFGLLVIASALLTLIVGVLGAELFLSRSSFVLLLGGLVISFLGWRFFGAVFFPWAVLFLMIPVPAIIYNQITFPLQFLASQLATSLLSLLGVPVLREGNVIHLPAITLEVVEACSGIRSLLSLTTLAVMYGYFAETRIWKRAVLTVAAIPIAVAANGIRIMGTGLLGQYWDPDKAEGFFHAFSGWVLFVLSLGMLSFVHWLMNVRVNRKSTGAS
jgi:exosortase